MTKTTTPPRLDGSIPMRTRNQLHLTKLDEFATFCESNGYVRETPIAEAYEVLRLRKKGAPAVIAHKRDCAKQHATLHGQGQYMFDRWMDARRCRRCHGEGKDWHRTMGGAAKGDDTIPTSCVMTK